MSESILPPAQVPGLPDETAIEWGLSVQAPTLLALANAAIHMVAARGRRWTHRTFTPSVDPRTPPLNNSIPDMEETHTVSLEPSPHAMRYSVRVVYQGDPGEKLVGGAFITATLMDTIDGSGTDLDEVTWSAEEGTLALGWEGFDNTLGQQFALLEVQTAYPSRPGAGASVSRPLEIGVGVPSPDFTIKVVSSEYIRVLEIEMWEEFEEVIEQ